MRSRFDRISRHLPLAIVSLAALTLFSGPVQAQNVLAGVDLFVTPANMQSYQDMSGTPIPGGFFGPGSDPFTGIIYFTGVPLSPLSPLGPTDTVVRRNATANLPTIPSSAPVPIEIIALSLVSVNPITVTYNGGATSEPWNVRVALSSFSAQPLGTMTVTKTHVLGGTFSSVLPVRPRFIFTQVNSPFTQVVVDPAPVVQFTSGSYWTYSAAGGFCINNSPGGILVDHDQNNGTPPVGVGATSNFVAGFRAVWSHGPEGEGPPTGYGKNPTAEEALLAKHGVLPPQCNPPSPDGQEGAACLPDGSCIVTTPTMAAAMSGGYHGANTACLGDLDHNGQDDACTNIPGASPWSIGALVVAMLGAGLWFVARGRRAAQPMA